MIESETVSDSFTVKSLHLVVQKHYSTKAQFVDGWMFDV